jgi:activating signal cointegrator complex subunit 3
VVNPTYYGMSEATQEGIDDFLSRLVEDAVGELEESRCVAVDDEGGVEPLTAGRICSFVACLSFCLNSVGGREENDRALT